MAKIDETNFSLEDLKDMGFFKENGKPTEFMTDELWQKIFEQLKEQNVPFINGEKMKMKFRQSKVMVDEYGKFMPDETTAWQRYCMFINNTLKDIRNGETAYCYFIYQIKNLLRFHPNLKSKFVEYYFEVWLNE